MMNGRVGLKVLLVLSIDQSVKGDKGEPEVIGFPQPIKVGVGSDVILPCHLEPPFDVKALTVEWSLNDSIVHLYRHGQDDLTNQDDRFKERTSLFHEEMAKGNISLKLSRVELLDAGHYRCFVPKLHSQVKQGYVDLTVDPDSTGGQGNRTGPINDPAEDKNNSPEDGGVNKTDLDVGVGVVVSVLVLAFVIALLCYLKRRQSNEGSPQRTTTEPQAVTYRADGQPAANVKPLLNEEQGNRQEEVEENREEVEENTEEVEENLK